MRRASPFLDGQFPQNVVLGVDLGLSAQNMTFIANARLSLTPRYKGFEWYYSGVPDQVTLSGWFASLFLRWNAHT